MAMSTKSKGLCIACPLPARRESARANDGPSNQIGVGNCRFAASFPKKAPFYMLLLRYPYPSLFLGRFEHSIENELIAVSVLEIRPCLGILHDRLDEVGRAGDELVFVTYDMSAGPVIFEV